MFTGIIQALGKVTAIEPMGEDARLWVATGRLGLAGVQIGDSIAVNGVCLTVVDTSIDGDERFMTDVSGETLSCTTFGELTAGQSVNLEKSLTPSTPLGGHLVSGHVDGVGAITGRYNDGRSVRFEIEAPTELARYIAEKGSICVDGISLTVNRVDGAIFGVNIVPHTLDATTMGEFRPRRRVNLEVDLIARYLERLLLARESGTQ